MIKKHLLIILLLLPLSVAAVEEAEVNLEDTKNNTNGYSFDVFLTLSQDAFDAQDDSLNQLGSFKGDIEPSISLALNSPYHFFNKGNVGYYFNYNFRRFDLDKQDTSINSITNVNETDFGTSVNGYNLYASASVFYNFGKKVITSKKDSSIKVGIGAGLGYVKADGDIILTERENMPLQNVNISSFGPVLSIFLDYRKGPWILRFDAIGTEISDGSIDFSYITIPLQIGYTVNF